MIRNGHQGFTLIEIMIVVAIVGVLAYSAVPKMSSWARNQRAKSAIRSVASSFSMARSEAIRTGNNYLVFFQTDAAGNLLLDSDGLAVPISIVDDQRAGAANQNCSIDAGETMAVQRAENGVLWGAAMATARVTTDFGVGVITTGSSFTEPDGDAATWTMFRPNGIPVSFDSTCAVGGTGSGAGAIYVTNGDRDYAAVLTALGGIRVHAWDNVAGTWTN